MITSTIKIEVKEAKHYWASAPEVNEAAVRFFDNFCHSGGWDLALLRAGLSRGQVGFALERMLVDR